MASGTCIHGRTEWQECRKCNEIKKIERENETDRNRLAEKAWRRTRGDFRDKESFYAGFLAAMFLDDQVKGCEQCDAFWNQIVALRDEINRVASCTECRRNLPD